MKRKVCWEGAKKNEEKLALLAKITVLKFIEPKYISTSW